MRKIAIAILFASAWPLGSAIASCPITNTLTNGTTADATKVMGNFTDLATCTAPLAGPTFTGNVGIGTSSPSSPLHVVTGDAAVVARITNAYSTHYTTSDYSAIATLILTNTYGSGSNNSAGVMFAANNPSGASTVAAIGGVSLGSSYESGLVFMTRTGGGTDGERMRITSTGNVGIATTSPSYTLHVNGSVAGTSAYNNLSDARLKKDITAIRGALPIVEQLQGVRFRWRTSAERPVGKTLSLPTDAPQIGFIAQSVGKLLPEAVTVADGPDAIMSIQESKVVPVLVEAFKELKAINDNQAGELRALRSRVSVLERKGGVRSAAR